MQKPFNVCSVDCSTQLDCFEDFLFLHLSAVFHGKYQSEKYGRNTAVDSANDCLIGRRQFNLVYEGFC